MLLNFVNVDIVAPTHCQPQRIIYFELVERFDDQEAGNVAIVAEIGRSLVEKEYFQTAKLFECAFEVVLVELFADGTAVTDGVEFDLDDGVVEKAVLGKRRATESLSF